VPVLIAILLVLLSGCEPGTTTTRVPPTGFSGTAALEYARVQLEFGPRVPGSEGWRRTGDWLVQTLRERADTVFEQRWEHRLADGGTIPQRNIIAQFRPELQERVLYVAHWDTRPVSDAADTPEERRIPVPGANDNAGGVGLLLALADVLRDTPPAYGVDILLVDGEDYGSFDAMTDVLIGSTYFARNVPWPGYRPLFGVVWDMIGQHDLRIPYELHSLDRAPEVVARVWSVAADRGLAHIFVPEPGQAVTDDHLPLLNAGFRVINVIDIDYEHHHRPTDTLDKISAQSLQVVGDVATELVLRR
jgi:glutaminyl-peptide cyclotransferase